MTALLPSRISIYDFLIEDTQPIDALIADIGRTSIPQARIVINNGIQAIVSALLSYHQHLGPDAVLNKLLQRNQIKELRKFNAFNFKTIYASLQLAQPISEVLFHNSRTLHKVCNQLANLASLSESNVKPMIAVLSLLCLREIAIISDFSQLDNEEIDTWLSLQPQYIQPPRFEGNSSNIVQNEDCSVQSLEPIFNLALPRFDESWHELTGYKPPPPFEGSSLTSNSDSIPHYAKVIGHFRTPDLDNNDVALGELNKINDNGGKGDNGVSEDDLEGELIESKFDLANKDNNALVFTAMPNINLPYKRWLLQLAKIVDIYLSRNRLEIASEPVDAPMRPFVSFGFKDERTTATASEAPIEYDEPLPLWRNPVILFIIAVIGGLGLLAIGKYHYKEFMKPSYTETSSEDLPTNIQHKDIAIVKVAEE